MTGHLVLEWPDRELFAARDGRPVRLLAISDEPEPSLDSARTREALQPIELIVGCGDLQPEYLAFLADAFCVPLVYVRGNHDVGAAWRHEQRASLPAPLMDGVVPEELGLRVMGFSGSPRYNDRELQFSAGTMWMRAVLSALSPLPRPPRLTRLEQAQSPGSWYAARAPTGRIPPRHDHRSSPRSPLRRHRQAGARRGVRLLTWVRSGREARRSRAQR